MSKVLVFDGVTTDQTSGNLERSPGNAGVFVQIAPVGHGRVRAESSADGALSWVPCRTDHGEEAVFNGHCYCGLQEHGGNTLIRFIVDQTTGSTTGITVYMTIEE